MTGTIAEVRSLAVVGLGRSGRAAVLLARRELPGAEIVAIDEKAEAELGDGAGRAALGRRRRSCSAPTAALPERRRAARQEPRRAERLAGRGRGARARRDDLERGRVRGPVSERTAGSRITGTNGKTTTTELAGQILRDAGLPVEVAGNVGRALANLPGEIDPEAVVVAELSSFQLEHIERFRPDVAVLLNLTEDHIDRHGSFGGYVDAKLRDLREPDAGRSRPA